MCRFIFGLWRVSLAEYIPVLRVYSLLLQMTIYIRDSVSIISTRRVMKTRSWAWSLFSYLNAFAGCDQRTSMCIWTRVCKLNYLLPHVLQDFLARSIKLCLVDNQRSSGVTVARFESRLIWSRIANVEISTKSNLSATSRKIRPVLINWYQIFQVYREV